MRTIELSCGSKRSSRPKTRGGDIVGLDALGASREGLLDHMPEEAAVPLGGVEIREVQHAQQLRPYGEGSNGLLLPIITRLPCPPDLSLTQ